MIEVGNADVGTAFGEANRLGGSELTAAAGDDRDTIGEDDGRRHDGNLSEAAGQGNPGASSEPCSSRATACERPYCCTDSVAGLSIQTVDQTTTMNRTEPLTAHLAHTIRDIAETGISDPVADKATLCFLDFLASGLAGARSEVAAAGAGLLPAFGGGRSVLLARPERSSVLGAAFFNALVATAEDLDDSHRFASGLHLSAITFPAALALAQSLGASGRQLLLAAAAGYEISSRICRAADTGLRERGFHSTGAVGPFGACASACVLLGLDADRTAHALGIAASGAGGLFAFLPEGASVRHAHAASASVAGLTAALLARSGMTGPTLALEGKDGFFAAHSTGFDETFLRKPAPSMTGELEITNTYHKLFSTCGHALPAITALLAVRDEIAPRLEQVRRIEVRGYEASAALTNPDPATVGEAKFSLPFITALTLRYGDVSPREMSMEVLGRPEVRRLASRVEVVADPDISAAYPRLRSGAIEVLLADGSKVSKRVDAPIGMPENPVSADQVAAKFRRSARGLLSPAAQEGILSAIANMPEATSLDGLSLLDGTTATAGRAAGPYRDGIEEIVPHVGTATAIDRDSG